VLTDRGRALIDPDRPLAREPFAPARLVDCYGSEVDDDGVPYMERQVEWRPPGMRRNPWDFGYFLCRDGGASGTPDIIEKTGAKVAGWYYGRLLPERKVPWQRQCQRIYDDAVEQLGRRYPGLPCRLARYTDPLSVQAAIEELLEVGCETLIFQSYCSPIYSDLEEYAYAFPAMHALVAGRAKLIFGDQLGCQPALRRAYVALIEDQLGHPFARETYDARAHEYLAPLQHDCQRLLGRRPGRGEMVLSYDEYADDYWDPRGRKLSTLAAYRRAITEGYDYALEAPVEFVAENTDTMILHAQHKFGTFSAFDPYAPVPYPDWERPLRREFREGRTTAISLGCPVGPYRCHVAQAVADSVAEALEG
jgi:hypothetical protein